MPDNQQVATRQPSPFEVELASYEPQFAAALPGHIPVERFKRTVITALNAQPDLIKADRRSLFTACVRAAQDGLFPDGREAALVVFNSKNKKTGEWNKLVQYLPMVGGLIKRMRNSGELAAISAYVVFSNDNFDYELGDNPSITHKPCMGDRGQPIGIYAVAKLTNGETLREVMSVSEVEKVRAISRAKDDGPWTIWWEEMARKTVIRRLSKRLPGSSDIDDMLRREEEQYRHSEPSVPTRRPTREMFRETPLMVTDVPDEKDDAPHDPETGEVPEDGFGLKPLCNVPLVEAGNAKCEEGLAALEEWWKGLTPSERGELGAKGRSAGPHLEGWKVRAKAADERGGPATEESLSETITAALEAAKAPEDVDALVAEYAVALNEIPHEEWLPLQAAIDARRAMLAGEPVHG